MISFLIPLYYQLLEAYKPLVYLSPRTTINQSLPTPSPSSVLGVSTESPLNAPIGGEGQISSIALFGDSMINTLSDSILQKSLVSYFPKTKFNLFKFAYSSTNLQTAISHLPEIISQQPDILVVESFAYNNFGNSENGLYQQTQLLKQITDTIKTELPKTKIIIAATIAPNSVVFGNGIQELHLNALDKIERTKTIRLYLENALNFAKSNNLVFVDAYTPSLINGDGYLPLISSTDHLHPSELGKQFFSDNLAQTLFHQQLIKPLSSL